MKNNTLIFSVFFILQIFIANPASHAQKVQPAATPFDFTFREDEVVAPPVRIELSAGTLSTDLDATPGIQGRTGIPSTSARVIAHPYQYFYNDRTDHHFLILPIDIELGIDGRSNTPYFNRIDIALIGMNWIGDEAMLRLNLAQYHHWGAPSDAQNNQSPIQINSFMPIKAEIMYKNFEDGRSHPIVHMQFAMPILASNDLDKQFNQAQQKYTPLMDPAQIPARLQSGQSYSIAFSLAAGLDFKQKVTFKYTMNLENYNHDGVYQDGSGAEAFSSLNQRTINLDFRIDKILRKDRLGKMSAGFFMNKQDQYTVVGSSETLATPILVLNKGTIQTYGIRMTWEPPNLKQRRQVRMHRRGY